MYTSINFKTKKAFKEAIAKGTKVSLWAAGLGTPALNGRDVVSGPQYPAPHSWYAEVDMKDGYVIKVK